MFEATVCSGAATIHDPDGLIHDVRWFSADEVPSVPFGFPEDKDLVLRHLRGRLGGAMPDLPVATAGAYILVGDRVPFVLGPTANAAALAVVRVGGHREEGESGWDGARREAWEEAGLRIEPVVPQQTYRAVAGTPHPVLVGRDVAVGAESPDPSPLLVIAREDPTQSPSVMYLATSRDDPVPSSEVKGLVLLRRSDVALLCQQTLTLREFVGMGGTVKIRERLETLLPLQPFGQLRLLREILAECPDLLPE